MCVGGGGPLWIPWGAASLPPAPSHFLSCFPGDRDSRGGAGFSFPPLLLCLCFYPSRKARAPPFSCPLPGEQEASHGVRKSAWAFWEGLGTRGVLNVRSAPRLPASPQPPKRSATAEQRQTPLTPPGGPHLRGRPLPPPPPPPKSHLAGSATGAQPRAQAEPFLPRRAVGASRHGTGCPGRRRFVTRRHGDAVRSQRLRAQPQRRRGPGAEGEKVRARKDGRMDGSLAFWGPLLRDKLS